MERENNLALIMRSARKYKGITQQDLAKAIHCSQSALSKMENGVLIPSAPQWFDFCKATDIPADSLVRGYIDRGTLAEVKNGRKENGHRISARYLKDRGMKIKHMAPILLALYDNCDREKLLELLKAKKFTIDFFIDLDNQISINFFYDVYKYLEENGKTGSDTLEDITSYFGDERVHGEFFSELKNTESPVEALTTYVSLHQKYQADFKMEIIRSSKESIELSIAPGEHVAKSTIFKDKGFCKFGSSYWLSGLEVISGVNKTGQKLTGQVIQSFVNGAANSIYLFS